MGEKNDGIRVNFGNSPPPEEPDAVAPQEEDVVDLKETDAVDAARQEPDAAAPEERASVARQEPDTAAPEERASVAPQEPGAEDEWDKEFADSGAATVIDSDALKKLREMAGLGAVSVSDTPLDGEAKESDTSAPAVVEKVEEVAGAGLLEAIDAGTFGEGENTDFDEESKTRMDPRVVPADVSAEVVGKEACPKCGVMVASGYPKCPRCRHSLVKKRRATTDAGGTTLGGRTIPWSIVFIVAVLTAIIVYLSERDPVIESETDEAADTDSATESSSESPKAESE